MATQDKTLLPWRDYSEHEVISAFSLDTTGQAGQLVKKSEGDYDQQNYWSEKPVGGTSYDGVISNLFENTHKVTLAASGDTKHTVLGLTAVDTLLTDANGVPLWHNKRGVDERAAVYSGQTVPIVRRGMFSIKLDKVEGTPDVGTVVIPAHSGDGKLRAVAASSLTSVALQSQVIGKWLGTGSRQGGYADFLLDL